MLKVGIVGAAGYAGAELVRIALRHPEFELSVITSNSDEGTPLAQVYPAFAGVTNLAFTNHENPELRNCDVVFLATPHTVAMKQAPALLEAGVTVVDLSADYRLRSQETYEHWYKVKHTSPELLETAVFGQPELNRVQLNDAAVRHAAGESVLVACAGCYPTATSLAAAPAIELSEGVVVADAISGVSGAGRSATARTHYVSANENFEAYGVTSHRHTPEIEQILGIPGRLVFTPHLAPATRGLLSTVTIKLTEEAQATATAEGIHRRYCDAYEGSPFVTVLPLGQQPKTSSVVGTNRAHVGVAYNATTGCVIATCAIDNIVKGAAGQAVQCANIVCGLPEQQALSTVANPS
jgi:N-acetyl-gamma-glutamyl-phosphate reductase common form